MQAVSIFTGAGGLDVGIERAGFQTVSTLEIHPSYCSTVREMQSRRVRIPGTGRCYFEGAQIIQGDIRETSAQQLMNGNGDVDCLMGGPPCQAFSSAGSQKSIFDERGTLVYEYFRILKEMRPKTFLFENVRGLVTARGANDEPGEVLRDLLARFVELGYNCRVNLLNAADYGAAQRRVRCFIVGSRIAAAPVFPAATHGKHATEEGILPGMSALRPWVTLDDYLRTHADADERNWTRPTAKLAEALADIPSGKGLRSNGNVEATRPGGHWGYRQGTFIADPALPARTVTGSSSQDWIRLADGSLRRLTLKEVAGLQGFPPEWQFSGSKADQFQQVGNAVPAVFGEVLGRMLYDYLDHGWCQSAAQNELTLPDEIRDAIRYTKYDDSRNGAYRVRRKKIA